MAITAGMVKELREMTGAGMMDCKKALAETNGDMDAAVEFLRKNGQAKAEKKAGRIAAEGIVKTVVKEARSCHVFDKWPEFPQGHLGLRYPWLERFACVG